MHRLRGGTPNPNSSLSLVGRLLSSKAKRRRLATFVGGALGAYAFVVYVRACAPPPKFRQPAMLDELSWQMCNLLPR